MVRKRAAVDLDNSQRVLGIDLLDRLLEAEGLTELPVIEVAVGQIDPNPYQTRRGFDEAGLEELATSMREHGFYGHLVAREEADHRYQIAYGERRLRAAQRAGLPQLPLVVRELTDEQMMELAITENVLREDLNPIEEAEAYRHLADLGRSVREISRRVGKSPGHISLLLSLLRRDDVAQSVLQGRVGIREGHEIAKVDNAALRRDLLDRTARGELNRAAVQEAVRHIREQGPAPPPARQPEPERTRTASQQSGAKTTPPAPEAAGVEPELIRRVSKRYDPLPNLRAALKRIEKIRPDRFGDVEAYAREDVRALLDEIASRTQYLLRQLEGSDQG